MNKPGVVDSGIAALRRACPHVGKFLLAASAMALAACSGGGASAPAAPAVSIIQFTTGTATVGQSAGSVSLSVARTGGSSGAIAVHYASADGTAVAGAQYTQASGDLNWADGDSTTRTISVPISDTPPFVGDKAFSVTLSNPTGNASLGSTVTQTITITGDGAPGELDFAVTALTVAQSAGTATLTVNRTHGTNGAVSVGYATANGSAIAGTDYTQTSGTLSWADGDGSAKTVTVPISNAAPFSNTRAFTVTLASPTGGAVLGTAASVTVTIAGDGSGAAAGSLSLASAAYSVSQSAGTVVVSVGRVGGTSGAVSVAYATTNGSAVAGTDYVATNGTLSWAAGDGAAKSVSIPISATASFTGTKTFSIAISAATGGASLGTPTTAVISIVGNAASGALAFATSAYSVAQTAGTVTVMVNRTGGSAGAVAVSYATADGTAVAGRDYTATNGTLNWAAGDTTAKSIAVAVSNATPFAGTRAFQIALSQPTGGATIGATGSATVTISGSGSSGTVAFSLSSYTVAQTAGQVTIQVNRSGGSAGAISVGYATSNGTALAGSDYTATSGTLSWAAGDSAAKSFSISISNSTPFSGSKALSVALSGATGGAGLGSPASAAVTITGSHATALAIKVSGNHFVDQNGVTVQLRGVNVSGLESVAVNGYSPSNPWAWGLSSTTPNWTTIKTWGVSGGPAVVNAVRLPLNESSWLNQTCTDVKGDGQTLQPDGTLANNTPGQAVKADPGNNYRTTVQQSVADATAAGLYVILDLHWTAPNNSSGHPACPFTQNAMADADNSIAFWTSVANAFKGYPNVVFELFNEPFLDATSLVDDTPWQDLLSGGGTLSSFLTAQDVVSVTWHNAGMQQMLDAIRATGATNVILTAPLNYASSMDQWLAYRPTDRITPSQLGAVWHAYNAGDQGYPTQVSCYDPDANPQLTLPSCSAIIMSDVQAIAKSYPVVVTEFGDTITSTSGAKAPWASVLLPFADQNGLSYLGWTWNPWQGYSQDVLITDDSGTPTFGYGQYVKAHYQCVAAGTKNCP